MLRNKKKYSISFIIGILLIVVSISLITANYFSSKKLDAFNQMNILLLDSEMPLNISEDDINENTDNNPTSSGEDTPEKPKPKPIDYTPYYVGTLEIPKIKLRKGFLDINSPYNNVNRNVTVIKTSTYPDVEKGNFILAAHTGSSSISFFTKLHDLSLGDLAYIFYKNKKYTYELVDIYTQPKVGTVSIYRDEEKTTLTLITCTKNTQATQTIFILELISVE